MKKVLFMAALMMAVLPTEAQQVKYSINGISNENGKTVVLRDRLTNQIVNSTVVTNGKFSMSGNAEKNAYMGVSTQDASWFVMLFNDGTPVTINLNDSTLKGSPQNERLTRYDIDINAPYASFMMKVQSMSEEEREQKKVELSGGLMIAMMKMMEGVEKIFKDERETLIPVAVDPRRLYQRVSADVRSAETRQRPRHQARLDQSPHRQAADGAMGLPEGSGGKEIGLHRTAVHRPGRG